MHDHAHPQRMRPARSGWTEAERAAALERYGILDTPREPLFEEVAALAAEACEVPVAMVNFVSGSRQWSKAESTGTHRHEVPLDMSICHQAILQGGLVVVPDLSADPRFGRNPFVASDGGLRFYAGAPIETPEGLPIGTVCVLDTTPRPEGLGERQGRLLLLLARQVMTELELRRIAADREAEIERLRAAEQALRASERRFRALFDQAATGVLHMGLDGRWTQVNRRLAQMLGHDDPGELAGRTDLGMTHPEDRADEPELLAELDRGERPFIRRDKRYLRRDGTPLWVGVTLSSVLDEEGRPAHRMAVVEDIAERRAAQDRLREQADELAALYAAAPVGLTVLDHDLRYVRINDRLAEINGLSAAEHIGRTVREIVPDLDEQAVAAMRRVLAGEALLGVEFSGTTPAQPGVMRTWRENWVPLRDASGEIRGITISAEEVTAGKAEERRQAFRLALTERLRDLGDARAMMDAASELLGRHLGAAQVGFGEIDAAQAHLTVQRDWTNGRLPSVAGRWPLANFGRGHVQELMQGRTVAVRDVREDPRNSDPEVLGLFEALGIRGLLNVPLVRQDRWLAGFFIHHPEPRAWTSEEVALVEETCERLWAAVERARAEAELRRSEARFRAIFEQAPLLVHIFDPQGRTVMVNPAVAEVFGLPPEAIRDYNVLKDPQPHANGTREALERTFFQGEVSRSVPVRHDAAVSIGTGRAKWIESLGYPIKDETGAIVEVAILSQDVTDRVEAEAALRTSEAEFRTRLDAIPQMVWSTRPDGHHDFYNARWYEFTGVPQGSTDGAGWNDMFHPEDQDRAMEVWRRSLATGEPYEIEYRLRHQAGDYRWVLGRALPLRGEDGRITRWMGTCTDIDDLRRATDELRRVSALLQLISDATPDMIYAKDLESRIIYANVTAQRAVGLDAEGMMGLCDLDWSADAAQARAIMANDRRAMETGEPVDVDETFTRPDGQIVYYRSVKAPLRDGEGRIIGVVGVTSDVTLRRQAEERERLLAREVDHRAKNMLAVVQSVVQLTRAGDISAFKAAVVGRIQAMARAHSLLAASRWEGIELGELVREEFAPFVRASAERVRLSGPYLRLRPEAAQALALVLHELTTNAAKYGSLSVDQGWVRVGWALVGPPEDRRLELSWEERGGPPVAAPDRRGFGSTLVRTSVERQLGGTLELDWRGEGLTARIGIPADQVGLGEPVRTAVTVAPAPDLEPRSLRGRSVLVVEDEALIALQIDHALTGLGARVAGPAATVAGALRLLAEQRPDAAVLDLNLGGERSDEVARALRMAGVPFVLCTGYAEDVDLSEALAEAPRLGKPLQPGALAAALAQLTVRDR